jgi:DNA-directed RNA polymerase sigma subunit (sigma70/sigma32)
MAKKADIREMAKLYENGMTLQEIGDRYGISRQRVQQRFRAAGLAQLVRPSKYTLIDKTRLETLYARERSYPNP